MAQSNQGLSAQAIPLGVRNGFNENNFQGLEYFFEPLSVAICSSFNSSESSLWLRKMLVILGIFADTSPGY